MPSTWISPTVPTSQGRLRQLQSLPTERGCSYHSPTYLPATGILLFPDEFLMSLTTAQSNALLGMERRTGERYYAWQETPGVD